MTYRPAFKDLDGRVPNKKPGWRYKATYCHSTGYHSWNITKKKTGIIPYLFHMKNPVCNFQENRRVVDAINQDIENS